MIEEIKKYPNELKKRFWEKVDMKEEDECWYWKAGTQSQGYGSLGIGNGKTALAHRVAFELTNGEIQENSCVMHKCDNKLCCNPNHLALGTIADNNQDMVEKGRQAKGEIHGMSKLTNKMVIRMRSDYSEGKYTYEELAEKFGVHKVTVKEIVEGKTWSHLPLAE